MLVAVRAPSPLESRAVRRGSVRGARVTLRMKCILYLFLVMLLVLGVMLGVKYCARRARRAATMLLRWLGMLLLLSPTPVDGCDCSWTNNRQNCGSGDGSRCWIECCQVSSPPPRPPPLPPYTVPPPAMPMRAINFIGANGTLYANGVPYKLKGLNWWCAFWQSNSSLSTHADSLTS